MTDRKRITAREEIVRLNSELEQRVLELTARLEAANKELENFAYSVSHDLRAPLRSIRGFSEILLEQHAAQLDARGLDFLRRIGDSGAQMERLLEGLLRLSRIGRAELRTRTVDLSRLAAEVAKELRLSGSAQKVRFSIGPGLEARGDEQLLRVLFENLLDNACKFTSRRPDPVVEVGYDEAQTAFYVRDNGAGFDLARADRLFGVFQRQHSAAEFPGIGVGLAIVRRIVTRHGGRVWAHAAVDKGATFYFSLPLGDP